MDAGLVKIYSDNDLPRLKYIAGVILGDILGLGFELTHDRRKLGKHPVINYSVENIPGAFRISPSGLLHESGISPVKTDVTEFHGVPCFFRNGSDSDFGFDIFSASFFLITRYEEYTGESRDEHGRYKASASLAFREGFLQTPVIDLWARELAKMLVKKFKFLTFRRNEFRSLTTFDTDQPFAYLGKGFLRSVGGLLKDLGSKEGHPAERYKAMAKGEKDPFDVFDYIFEKLSGSGTDAMFFFPQGDHSRFDKNPSWKSREYIHLIQKTREKFRIGLHPSYYAADNGELLKLEISRLRSSAGIVINAGRYHYLRIFMPGSYRILSNNGITEDYSMGYPEEPGFRAGISRPFRFYDLGSEMETGLIVYPIQVMDATLLQYKGLSAEKASEVVRNLIDVTRKAGGLFVSLWHNTTITDDPAGREWRNVFEEMLQYQKP